MITLHDDTFLQLKDLANKEGIYMVGDIIKYIKEENDEQAQYLEECLMRHKSISKERYTVSQRILKQNVELRNQQERLNILVQELSEETQLLQVEKNKNEELLKVTKDQQLHTEEKLTFAQEQRKLDIINNGLRWVLIFLGLVLLFSFIIIMTVIISGDKNYEIILNPVFNIFSSFLVGGLSIVGSLLGVKQVMDKKNT
jgi:hypothetical protein